MAQEKRSKQQERHRRIKEDHPILGRLALALADEPDAGRSWETGAVGEQRFGAALDQMVDRGVLVLHDRRLVPSKANIDHIAIARNGVWVIDAKRYRGLVTKVDKGGWLRADIRLTIGGRDRTALADGVLRQVDRVRQCVSDNVGDQIPVRGALCFVDAEFRLFAKPFEVRGVLVSWGKALRERLVEPGPLTVEQQTEVHRQLARSFPPA
jgi:hypothetical protein